MATVGQRKRQQARIARQLTALAENPDCFRVPLATQDAGGEVQVESFLIEKSVAALSAAVALRDSVDRKLRVGDQLVSSDQLARWETEVEVARDRLASLDPRHPLVKGSS